ncbi:MAG: VWA domain-containing protein [Planctomycetaceae bacterium]|nr:VWA domain-containing protein [Planctomycetaceae bacterium]
MTSFVKKLCVIGAVICLVGCEEQKSIAPPLAKAPETSVQTAAPTNVATTGTKSGIFGHDVDPTAQVVYLIDRSGSMSDSLAMIERELVASFGCLRSGQEFHIIFYNGQPHENPAARLIPATDANKYQAYKYVQAVKAHGLSNPVPAMERTFQVLRQGSAERPRVIHFLSDGAFPDNDELLATVRRLNQDKSVRIHTYLCGQSTPLSMAVMKRIAAENNGRYAYLTSE